MGEREKERGTVQTVRTMSVETVHQKGLERDKKIGVGYGRRGED